VNRYSEPDPELLQQFFNLEQSGWKGKEGSAINCRPETQAFYKEIAKGASAHGTFCLHSLEANSRMIAGAFSVATSDGFFPIKVAYDETLKRGGPGHLLFNAIVTECLEKHIPELFFGGTDEHYKSLWTQEKVALYNAFVFSADIRSQLAYRVRHHLLSPLGKLRWFVRQRYLQSKNGASKRRSISHPQTGREVQAKATQPAPARESRSGVHSS